MRSGSVAPLGFDESARATGTYAADRGCCRHVGHYVGPWQPGGGRRCARVLPDRNLRGLGGHPTHYRHRADGVLWAALDHAVAVRYVYQDVSTAVKEAHDVQLLEQKTAPLVEDGLTVMQITRDMDRTNLAAGDTGIARILCNSQRAFNAAGNRTADVAGNPLHFRVIKTVYRDSIVGPP
jgi:hypothetical protein